VAPSDTIKLCEMEQIKEKSHLRREDRPSYVWSSRVKSLFGIHYFKQMREKSKGKFEVLFVCTGNTCRSPMAEGILKKMLKKKGISHINVNSAGTHAMDHAPASLFAMEVARAGKVDLSRHRSRELNGKMLQEADLILVMSQDHLDHIKRMNKDTENKIFLLKAFPHSPSVSNEDKNRGVLFIKDPMGGSLDDYERSFSEIEREIERIFPQLVCLAEET
jgi:protein-tyrosine-phosphatase